MAKLSTQEKIAVGFSAAILLAAAVYWTVQIIDTIATIKLAGSLYVGLQPEKPIQRPDAATTNQIVIDASAISLSVHGLSCA